MNIWLHLPMTGSAALMAYGSWSRPSTTSSNRIPKARRSASSMIREAGLAHAREAQFLFLSGFLGGPQLYVEQFYHSNVKQMHAHLRIGPREASAWLTCMEKALQRTADAHTAQQLMQNFTRVVQVLQKESRKRDLG